MFETHRENAFCLTWWAMQDCDVSNGLRAIREGRCKRGHCEVFRANKPLAVPFNLQANVIAN